MTAPLMSEQTTRDPGAPVNPHVDSLRAPVTPEICQESTSHLLHASFFDNAWDNKPRSIKGTWDQLKPMLEQVYKPGTPGEKRSMPAFSPAFYPPGTLRGLDHASGVGLLLLDFDNAIEEVIPGEFFLDPRTDEPTARPKIQMVRIEYPVTLAAVVAQLQRIGIVCMAWSTWSSTEEWPKFRVVIPLTHPAPVDSWERASEWALSRLDLTQFRRGLDIRCLHNAAALAFLPGSPDPGSICRAESIGAHLAIPLDALPLAPAPTLTPWQAAVVADRRAKSEHGERWWMAYRVNGRPVDFKNLDLAVILFSHGIKVGRERSFKNGTKRRAHCPWASEHTHGLDDDSVVLIQTPGTWPSFKCSHSGHAHMGLRDLLEWAWGRP